ncbi:hypothetical protein KEJ39_02360 [Candidatus Bathyarchaeota archaeon]|nr:hypothetical protein [Candidatus Bathyarchaeota archaeon]
MSQESESPEEAKAEAAASRRQIYALVGLFMVSVLVIGVVLAILSAGVAGGGGSWWSRVTVTHTPITKAMLGQDIEVTARVTGWPKNVTLTYTVVPNNSTTYTFRNIQPKIVFMLLLSAGGDQYAYTIQGTEVLGDISYHIAAVDAYGNAAATPTMKIAVDDFAVSMTAKEMSVYVAKSAKTTVTVTSFNSFSSPVALRAVALGLETLPGGLAAEFNPATVTPPKGGSVTSELTIRSTSTEFVPAGRYYVKVEGIVGTPRGSIIRNSSIAILKVPDFSFEVTPSSQSVTRQVIGELVERITPFNITLNIEEPFEAPFSFRVIGLPVTGVYHRWVVANATFTTAGRTVVTLQIITRSVAQLGTYTLTIYVTGGGLEKFKQVTFNIYEVSQQ